MLDEKMKELSFEIKMNQISRLKKRSRIDQLEEQIENRQSTLYKMQTFFEGQLKFDAKELF